MPSRKPNSPPWKVALKGISRSFQIVRLFNNLTVVENIETASLAHGEAAAPSDHSDDEESPDEGGLPGHRRPGCAPCAAHGLSIPSS